MLIYESKHNPLVYFMAFRTNAKEHTNTVEVEVGKGNVAKAGVKLGQDRAYASLSHVAALPPDYYWISVQNKELAPRVPEGQAYKGRTFEGVPPISGYFANNADGTFTKLQNRSHADWHDRLFVSPNAAANIAKGEAPVRLLVGSVVFYDCRLIVSSGDRPADDARVASVYQNQSVGSAAAAIPIPKEIVMAARQEYDSQIWKNQTQAAKEFPAYRALLEHAERQ